jgi:hypothetical protein
VKNAKKIINSAMQLSQQEIVVKFEEILPIFDSFANIFLSLGKNIYKCSAL